MHKLLPILLFAYGLATGTTQDIYDDSWALIIGIDKYQNVEPLNYAVSDAVSIREMFIEKYGRGYLLHTSKHDSRWGQKYFLNGWWMPSQNAWFFKNDAKKTLTSTS